MSLLFVPYSHSCEISTDKVKIKYNTDFIDTVLCNTEYTSYYSSKLRIPIFTTEIVEKTDLVEKGNRTNDFKEDKRLSKTKRALLKDYVKSGFDRGHLSASANTSDPDLISESFLMSNMIPQDPQLNRTVWKNLENYTRIKANLNEKVFVITGITFNNCLPTEYLNNGRVAIPDKVFKLLIYNDQIEGYIADNKKPLTNELKSYRVELDNLNDLLCWLEVAQ